MVLITEGGEELVANIGFSGGCKNLPPLLCTFSETSNVNLMFALRRLLCNPHIAPDLCCSPFTLQPPHGLRGVFLQDLL